MSRQWRSVGPYSSGAFSGWRRVGCPLGSHHDHAGRVLHSAAAFSRQNARQRHGQGGTAVTGGMGAHALQHTVWTGQHVNCQSW